MTYRLSLRAPRAALIVLALVGGASAWGGGTVVDQLFGPHIRLSSAVVHVPHVDFGPEDINGDDIPDRISASGPMVHVVIGNQSLNVTIESPVREVRMASRHAETGVALLVLRADDGLHLITITPQGDLFTMGVTPLATGSFGFDFETSLISRDVNGDGTPDIVAINLATSDIVVFPVAPNGVLLSPITSPTSAPDGAARKLLVVDLDGDGHDDAAVVSASGGVFPVKNNGSGMFVSFDPPAQGYGGNALSGAAADFTGDGDQDIFMMGIGGQGRLLVGDGAGAFTTPFPMIQFPSGAAHAVAADVDGDGFSDILSANYGDDTVSFLRGDGAGGFDAPINIPVGDGPIVPIVGDWDGDGDVDVIVSHNGVHFPQGPIFIENTGGLGDNILESFLQFRVNDARSMAVGDWDGDGRTDVLVGSTSNAVRLMRGQEGPSPLSSPVVVSPSLAVMLAGTLEPADGDPRDLATFMLASPSRTGIIRFDPSTSLATFRQVLTPTASPISVAAGDVTGDGREDLIVGHAGGSPSVTIYPQNAGAMLNAPILINGPGGGKSLVVRDLDDDLGPDLVLGDDGVFRYTLSTGPGAFDAWTTVLVPEAPTLTDVAVGDFDGVPGLDVAMVGLGPDALGRLVIVPQLLAPAPAVVIPLPGAPRDVVAVDVNGDGDTDLAITLDRGGLADALAILLSVDGQISGDSMTLHQTGDQPVRVVFADLHEPNGVVQRGAVARPAPEAIVLNTGNAILGFRGVTVNLNMAEVRETPVCPGDVDGDGFIGFADLNAVVSAFNTFDGNPGYNASADFDGDGDVDFADLNVVLGAFNTEC